MTKYTVPKGQHAFKIGGILPAVPVVRRGIERVEWRVKFAPNCAYSLTGVDQGDWNKGGGVSFDLLENHQDAAMWGWRYNPLTGLIELTAYCHINGKRPFLKGSAYSQSHPGVSGEVCLEVEFGMEAVVTLVIGRKEKRYDLYFAIAGGKQYKVGVPYTHNKTMGRIIHPWFGGNNAAPHRMDIDIKRSF